MGVAVLLVVVAWACVPTAAAAGNVAAEGNAEFLRLGEGRCGLPILQRKQVTFIHCAAICAGDPRCEGFNVAAKRREKGLCEVTDHVTSPDLNVNFTCYVTVHLYWSFATLMTTFTTTTTTISVNHPSTAREGNTPPNGEVTTTRPITTTALTTGISTTANTATSITGPTKLPSDLGLTGVMIIGFTDTTDSSLSVLRFTRPPRNHSPSPPHSEPVPTPSVVTQGGGEECAPGQVMIGVGSRDTGDSEKDDQRMFCSKLTAPLKVLSTCQQVQLGQGPRPMIQKVDTSSWINWLACPDDYVVTRLDWVYDASAPVTEYRYSSAHCCEVEDF